MQNGYQERCSPFGDVFALNQAAFTKVDVLVTLVCVSLLVLSLGAVGLNGREMAKRAVCASNINQNLEAMLTYANESDGELPKVDIPSIWLHELKNVYVKRFIEQYGMYKEIFYCPSNNDQQRYMDVFYLFNSLDPLDPSEAHGFIITGYAYLLEVNIGSPRPPIGGNGNKQWLGQITVENPDQAELVIDRTFSSSFDVPEYIEGYRFGSDIYDSSNHLKSEAEPWGGNMGFLDGHVKWRPFSEMEMRYPDDSPLIWWW